ncbi:MAG: ABC transporter substrate-binding protein [Alphaproteobacteria bacterium]|nr:ABC transporter substrate-binding protein [Alphaproteobacteria bacterium]
MKQDVKPVVETPAAAVPQPQYGVAMHGTPKYGPDFQHLDYVNTDAPKGGEIYLADAGTFDNLNPFILKGVAAPGTAGLLFQTLMVGTSDEAFSEYGLLAQSMEMPEDRSWVVFNLRPQAKWNDGTPVTAQDVVWTFHTLMTKGHPFYRAYYAKVKDATAESPTRVKFTFTMAGNRELPLIMGQMPVLPEHYWKDKDFSKTTLVPPLGSGPYEVDKVDPGRRITYKRVKNWWAAGLPIVRGQYNFDAITYDMYRDETVMLQAFFAGAYDFRLENIAKAWHTEYEQKPVKEGWIRKEEIHNSLPAGMQAFAYNIRRDIFKDPRVRHALNYAFDFEWSNKQFAYGDYTRTASYFDNSELAATGKPEGRELEILKKYKDDPKYKGDVPDEALTEAYANPKTSGTGRDMRANLSTARQMLEAAGWHVGKSGVLEKDGKPFKFEILINSNAFERWINPFIANLKRLGIRATLRFVDAAQYQNRMDSFDFDMTVATFGQSLSPGNEQRDFWGAEKADVKGSRNIIGIKNPVVDDLIDQIVSAPDRQELIARTHALDRVLLWNFYVIPQWHIDHYRIAYWDKFGRPDITPKYGLGAPNTWWFDARKAAALQDKRKGKDGK